MTETKTPALKFSVLMPVYWKETPEYFQTALESILNQTLMPDEIVIVEDGKLTDELNSLIKTYTSRHPQLFKIVALDKNVGQGLARNAGLKHCSNNLVALMDSDDIADKTRFEKQINYLKEHPQVDVIGSNITEFEGAPENIISRKVVPLSHDEIFQFGKWRSPMNNMTVVYKKDKVLKAGGYNTFNFGEDYYLFSKMLMNGAEFYNLEECLVNARAGSRMLAKRVGAKRILQEIQLFWKFYRMGYINIFELVRNVTLKFLLRIIPSSLRAWIYKKFLRKEIVLKGECNESIIIKPTV